MKENIKYGVIKLWKNYKNESKIIGTLKSARIDWADHVWRSKELIAQITAWN